MVRLSGARYYAIRTFGLKMKKYYNHRVPMKYKKFSKTINPDEIVEYYSRDDIDSLNQRKGQHTFKDAQQTMGRKNYLSPNPTDWHFELNEVFRGRSIDHQPTPIAQRH